jgi:polyphosphate kinase
MVIVAHHPFRVSRHADLTLEEEEADDLLAAVELELRRRRFNKAVRLEIGPDMDPEILALLVRELELTPEDVFVSQAPIDLGGLFALAALPRPDLKDEPWQSVTQPRLVSPDGDGLDLFETIRAGDLFVHHPYDSFTTSVTAFVAAAAADPDVLAIKQTLYRTSADSPIVQALIRANEAGKQVVALVELQARFDEQANVAWARALEQAGVHVVYGVVGLKTHSKISLVVRREADGLRRYCHLGTGNYNERTARLYEDMGLLTSDPAIGADASQLFNYITGFGRQERFRKLVVAPGPMRDRLCELIANEAALGGRIIMKMNSLVDPVMIDALYDASRQGAQIDLIVRGICCLRPGVEGLSETIRVRSIVGRFLEHSRVYHFTNGAGPGESLYYIGSADLMPRNLDRRVETLVPVEDRSLQARIQEVLEINLADDELAWTLLSTGSWQKVPRAAGIDTHEVLMARARERERGTD